MRARWATLGTEGSPPKIQLSAGGGGGRDAVRAHFQSDTDCSSYRLRNNNLVDNTCHRNSYSPLAQQLPSHTDWSLGQQPCRELKIILIYTILSPDHSNRTLNPKNCCSYSKSVAA